MRKTAIIIASVFLVLLAAVEFYVQTDSFAERIRPLVMEPLREVLGSDARIGFIKVNFIPPFLEARNISLPDGQGREVAAVRRIRVYINPLSLLFKKVRLPSVTVLEPRIYAQRAPDGSLNVVPVIEKIRDNLARSGKKASGFSVHLDSVTIKNGQVWYTDTALSSQASVTGINTIVRLDPSNDLASAHIRSSRVRITRSGYSALEGMLEATAEYRHGRLRLDDLEFASGDAVLNVSGSVNIVPEVEFDLKSKIPVRAPEPGKHCGSFQTVAAAERGTNQRVRRCQRQSFRPADKRRDRLLQHIVRRGGLEGCCPVLSIPQSRVFAAR